MLYLKKSLFCIEFNFKHKKHDLIEKKPSNFSIPLAKVEKGKILILKKNNGNWCKIKTEKFSAWVTSKNMWGLTY